MKRFIALGVAVLAATAVAAQATPARVAAPAAPQATKKTIALVSALASISYYTTMKCGAQQAAREQGVNLIYQAPTKFDAAEQQQIIQSLLVKKIDGLIVVPADTVALNNTLKSVAKKMPFMTTDLNPSVPIGLANIQSRGFDGGMLAAKRMAQKLGGKTGTVLVLENSPTIIPVVDRGKGFIAGMKKLAPKVKVLPVQYTGGEPADAATAVSNTLRAHSDLVGIFATFEPSVLGTISALAGSPKKSQITVVGYDADAAEVQAVKANKLDALVIQKPWQMGYDAVTQMAKVLKGTLKASQIKYKQVTPLVLATKANLNQPSVKKFLYSDSC